MGNLWEATGDSFLVLGNETQRLAFEIASSKTHGRDAASGDCQWRLSQNCLGQRRMLSTTMSALTAELGATSVELPFMRRQFQCGD